ncbi:MAG: hypothetical protein COA54_04310 [Thiotrichaceae bacterium]|nr:MAG: hypothetical protein COA54_04310 [Thiotrichaceae bacterium]
MNNITELPLALQPLAAYPQWVLWVTVERNGKLMKLPIDYRNGDKASVADPNTWTDAQTAINTARLWGSNYRVGFVFTDNDPFFFLDIDNCLQVDNTWSPLALELINMLPGAAVEISQSGKGLHIFGTYSADMPDHACKNVPLGIELYHKERFVALTGVKL